MNVKRDGSEIHITLDGPLGETSPLFILPMKDLTRITIDMDKFTYINSIGVKNWIIWNMKIPTNCKVELLNCPLMIASQASMVMGFVTPKIRIQSIKLPYVCENCGFEDFRKVTRGNEYEYSMGGELPKIEIPEKIECPKCKKETFDPDLIVGKTFRFLN